ncbi:hypothetical protein [Phaeacidiphilus oryzae]|uniref:hypothetical protein n=1 Tax=Phaeacidiphilus oryzae TaxID=348818 RepID=UPI0005611151|nr:hypothetical protein [Phaeacidiphilus oryzae]
MTGQMQLGMALPGLIDEDAGEAAKNAGIARADANTRPDWAAQCDQAIRTMAARGVVFQAADLIAEGLVDEPDHPNRWGARFYAAARAGIIRDAGSARSKRATVHRSQCRQWIGIPERTRK